MFSFSKMQFSLGGGEYNNKIGFTLSEVLITLVIIGIIAAITVPMVTANSNDKALKAALRKNHSVLAQAMNRYYIDNGEHIDYETDTHNNFILKYFNIAKVGIDAEDLKNIKYQIYSRKKEFPASQYYFSPEEAVLLTDGTLIERHRTIGSHNIQGFLIDVNGPYKKPNRLGIDTFYFEVYHEDVANKKIYQGEAIPGGTPVKTFMSTGAWCDKNGSGWDNGYGCTSKALNEK